MMIRDASIETAGRRATVLAAVALALASGGPVYGLSANAVSADSALASTPGLAAGEAGTVFGSLTVHGENRVQIEFERPGLDLDIDPHAATGLALESSLDVLNRTAPDLAAPLLDGAAHHRSRHIPRPWLTTYATDRVASFAPNLTRLASWNLQVVDSRGRAVVAFDGVGDPPADIAWDGRDAAGDPVPVGLTYSFVFEAIDRAGNRRRFVGDGFQLSAYRFDGPAGANFLVSGRQWATGDQQHAGGTSPYALAAAGWFNIRSRATVPVVVESSARTRQQAAELGQLVAAALAPWLQGGAERIRIEPRVAADSPEGGTLRILSGAGD